MQERSATSDQHNHKHDPPSVTPQQAFQFLSSRCSGDKLIPHALSRHFRFLLKGLQQQRLRQNCIAFHFYIRLSITHMEVAALNVVKHGLKPRRLNTVSRSSPSFFPLLPTRKPDERKVLISGETFAFIHLHYCLIGVLCVNLHFNYFNICVGNFRHIIK